MMGQPRLATENFYIAVSEKLPYLEINPANEAAEPFKKVEDKPSLNRTLLHVAWMAVMLGLVIEAMILVVATSFDKMPGAKAVFADLVQKVSWPVIVCISLVWARGATRLLATTVQTAAIGIASLLTAPMAFAVSLSLHEGIQEALFIKIFQPGGCSPLLLALIKGVEYGCLGALLAWVGKQMRGKAMAHVSVGLFIGLVFGALLIGVMAWGTASPVTLGSLLSRAINEVINPVGCSLILYSAEILGRAQTARDLPAA